MTGPEHYREAERLLDLSADELGSAAKTDVPQLVQTHWRHADYAVAVASVHAKLAAVASYVEGDPASDCYSAASAEAWRKAIGWPRT